MTITIKNWQRHQHYKSRQPPWVKLHASLLCSRQWFALSGEAAKQLICLWLLASETKGGVIEDSAEDIAFRLHSTVEELSPLWQELEAQGFISVIADNASGLLASRVQPAPESCPETETETEGEQKQHVVYSSEFEEVWSLHRKGSKQLAFAEYRRAVPKLVQHDELLRCLEAYVQSFTKEWRGAHLFRWLRDRRWEEAPETPGALKREVILPPAVAGT